MEGVRDMQMGELSAGQHSGLAGNYSVGSVCVADCCCDPLLFSWIVQCELERMGVGGY